METSSDSGLSSDLEVPLDVALSLSNGCVPGSTVEMLVVFGTWLSFEESSAVTRNVTVCSVTGTGSIGICSAEDTCEMGSGDEEVSVEEC